MINLYFILVKKAIIYYLYFKNAHFWAHYERIWYYLKSNFHKTLSSIDLVKRRTKSYQNLIIYGSLKIYLLDINFNHYDIYSLQLLDEKKFN